MKSNPKSNILIFLKLLPLFAYSLLITIAGCEMNTDYEEDVEQDKYGESYETLKKKKSPKKPKKDEDESGGDNNCDQFTKDMIAAHGMGHECDTGLESGSKNWANVLISSEWCSGGHAGVGMENIYVNQFCNSDTTPKYISERWEDSDGHRYSMEHSSKMGCGKAEKPHLGRTCCIVVCRYSRN